MSSFDVSSLLAIGSIGLTLFGGKMRSEAYEQAGESAEALGMYKAQLARKEAATKRGLVAEEQRLKRTEMRKTLARNREITAGSGLMMTGSPAERQLDVISDYAYDIARTGYEGEMEARRMEDMAVLYQMEAKAASDAARMNKKASMLETGANVLGKIFSMFD